MILMARVLAVLMGFDEDGLVVARAAVIIEVEDPIFRGRRTLRYGMVFALVLVVR